MIAVVFALCAAVLWWPVPMPRTGSRWPVGSRGSRDNDASVLQVMVDGLAQALAAGVAPGVAVASSCRLAASEVSDRALADGLRTLADHARRGDDLLAGWNALASRHRAPVLESCRRAWQLSHDLGCPLAASLTMGTDQARAQLRSRRRIAAAIAGPRATMQVLTALPLIGLALAWVAGLGPQRVLTSPAALITLVPGTLLIGCGRLLTSRLIARASSPRALT